MANTVSKKALQQLQARIKVHANDSIKAWVITGQIDKYSKAMEQVYFIEKALKMPVAQRREYLKSKGI